MPQFVLLLRDDPTTYKDLTPETWQTLIAKYESWAAPLAQQGRLLEGKKLTDGAGRLLRSDKGKLSVKDGPYAETKDVVNAAVKYREGFRPFAPAILAERAHEWFDCPPGTEVPFMEKVLRFRPERRAEVPAVVHADGSGRLQTVGRDASPRFRRLIECFDAATGVPLVLNTSFNLNGEPMVDSPEDAIRTFYSCGLEVLYLGDLRIHK